MLYSTQFYNFLFLFVTEFDSDITSLILLSKLCRTYGKKTNSSIYQFFIFEKVSYITLLDFYSLNYYKNLFTDRDLFSTNGKSSSFNYTWPIPENHNVCSDKN